MHGLYTVKNSRHQYSIGIKPSKFVLTYIVKWYTQWKKIVFFEKVSQYFYL